MLKSILLRMLAFALAFVVGVGSQVIFGDTWRPPVPENQSRKRPPIRFEFTRLGQGAEPLRMFFLLSNNSPYSIWVYDSADFQEYSVQKWIKTGWADIPQRCGTRAVAAKLTELKPHSTFPVRISPFLFHGTYRIGAHVFVDDLERPVTSFAGRLRPRRIPFPDEHLIIWSEPFKIQYQP